MVGVCHNSISNQPCCTECSCFEAHLPISFYFLIFLSHNNVFSLDPIFQSPTPLFACHSEKVSFRGSASGIEGVCSWGPVFDNIPWDSGLYVKTKWNSARWIGIPGKDGSSLAFQRFIQRETSGDFRMTINDDLKLPMRFPKDQIPKKSITPFTFFIIYVSRNTWFGGKFS